MFKLILSTFGTKNGTEYFVLVMFKCGQILVSMKKKLASKIQVRLFALSVPLCSNLDSFAF